MADGLNGFLRLAEEVVEAGVAHAHKWGHPGCSVIFRKVREYIAKRIPLIALKWVPSIALERVPASEPVIFSY